MFGWKKKKTQAQPNTADTSTGALTGTPPITPQKTKKANKKKDKGKDSFRSNESPASPSKRRGLFGKKSKAPTAPYNDTSSAASISSQQSSELNNTRNSNVTPPRSFSGTQPVPNGNVHSPSFGMPMSPSSNVTTGSVSGSYQENQSYVGRGFEEREIEFWDEAEVLMWLSDQGLDYFVELFEGCEIDGEYLMNVTDEDLVELEVDDKMLRKQFLDAVRAAQNNVQSNVPTRPTLDHQLSALSHISHASSGEDAAHKFNSPSEASTVALDQQKESPRNLIPPPRLLLRKPSPGTDNDSDSEFGFDSDLGSPLGDLPDNSTTKAFPVAGNASPTSPRNKSRNSTKNADSPRSPVDKPSIAPRSHKDAPQSKNTTQPSKSIEYKQEPPTSVTPSAKSPIDSIQSPGRPRLGSSRSRSESVVTLWSETDVVAWLQDVQLNHLKSHFIEHKVTGKQLLNIDMQLLDVMEINEDDDRELLLAKLYELSNPAANIPEKDLISAVNNTSGYEHRKYVAAMKVLQSSDSEEVQLLPPETLALTDSFSTTSRTPSTASDLGKGEEKKKKGGFSKLKGVISPKRRLSRDFNQVQVWTDIMRSGNTTVTLRLTETETVGDLIKLCLVQLGTVEDWRLYCILDATGSTSSDRKDKAVEREMEETECPVTVQQAWQERTPRHFELRQRPAHGGSIKIVLRLNDEKPRGKLLAISLSTPAREVVSLGLLKFGLKDADPKAFCLLEVDRARGLQDVDEDAIPLQSDSHAFVLCEAADRDSQLALSDGEGVSEELSVRRTDSVSSRGSSKVSFSGVSLGSSAGSDLLSHRIDDEKLSKLEQEMATIEESLKSKGTSKPKVQDSDSLDQLTSPKLASKAAGVSQSEIKQRDATIDALRKENKLLKGKSKQLSVVQKALGQLEQTYKINEDQCKQRVQDKQELMTKAGEVLPKDIADSQSRLVQIEEEIAKKKLNILKVQQQQKQVQGQTTNSSDDSLQQAELEYRVAVEESSMVTLQQQQAEVLSKMEVALMDHKAAVERKKSKSPSEALYPHLQANERYTIYTIQQSKGKHGWDFTLSAYQNGTGAAIQRCSKGARVKTGDRLLEVNGENINSISISEINQILSSQAKLRLVLLRETDREDGGEDMARMQQHLDATQEVNARLQEDVKRLKDCESQARRATQLQSTVQQLQAQLSGAEARASELELQLTDGDEMDQTMLQMRDDRHRLQMEVIQLKEYVCRLENTLDEKISQLAGVCQERDNIAEQLMATETSSSHHLINGALEEGLPLWEALKSSSKAEILEVLREELEEAGRQKEYLDQLYTLMLERAPGLLEDLEEDFDASELSDNEEFC